MQCVPHPGASQQRELAGVMTCMGVDANGTILALGHAASRPNSGPGPMGLLPTTLTTTKSIRSLIIGALVVELARA